MRAGRRRPLVVLAVTAVVLGLGPLVVPLPPSAATASPRDLADLDSRFVTVDGLEVHVKVAGEGRPVFVLLHGFGASLFSWREVMPALARQGTVIAFDRPGFGLTTRPLPGEWQGENPYSPERQVGLLRSLLDHFAVERAILVGHSAGGTVATQFALRHPERVQALVGVAPAVYVGGGSPAWLKPLLALPQARRLGPPMVAYLMDSRALDLIRLEWHDPAKVTPEIVEGYRKPTRAANWERALYELTLASHAPDLAGLVGSLAMPVLVVTGDDDRIVPAELSARLAREVPGARLEVIAACGHLPQEERPAEFLLALDRFVAGLP